MPRQKMEAWSSQEWAALAHHARLTQLTRLHVDVDIIESSGHDGFYDVLLELRGLHAVGAWVWDTDLYLPLLQTFTQLTEVSGGWSGVHGVVGLDANLFVCPKVRELREACCGGIPFAAFGNLTGMSFYEASADDVVALSRYCTALRRLELPNQLITGEVDETSMMAFTALATFKHLTHLELPPCDGVNFAAFVSAAAAAGALGAPKLHYLHMHRPQGGMGIQQLPQLATVCGVSELKLVVSSISVEVFPSPESVGLWLVGLAVVPKVSLVVQVDEHRTIVDGAKLWAAERGLPLPALLRVLVVPDEQSSPLAE
jgi:hypothetical protein